MIFILRDMFAYISLNSCWLSIKNSKVVGAVSKQKEGALALLGVSDRFTAGRTDLHPPPTQLAAQSAPCGLPWPRRSAPGSPAPRAVHRVLSPQVGGVRRWRRENLATGWGQAVFHRHGMAALGQEPSHCLLRGFLLQEPWQPHARLKHRMTLAISPARPITSMVGW
jgi:hypothetical protein